MAFITNKAQVGYQAFYLWKQGKTNTQIQSYVYQNASESELNQVRTEFKQNKELYEQGWNTVQILAEAQNRDQYQEGSKVAYEQLEQGKCPRHFYSKVKKTYTFGNSDAEVTVFDNCKCAVSQISDGFGHIDCTYHVNYPNAAGNAELSKQLAKTW